MKLIKSLILTMILSSAILACGNFIPFYGRVYDRTGRGVYGAVVVAQGVGYAYSIRTNPWGNYNLEIPNCGAYLLTVRAKHLSFDTISVFLPIADTDELAIDWIANE